MTQDVVQKIDQTQEFHAPADPMVSMIERIAMDPNSDLAKLEKMLEMKERHEASQARAAFAAAFARASAEFPTIPLNGKGHNGKPYATLKDITAKTRPVLSDHGLALTFAIDTSETSIKVTAKLMHKGGTAKAQAFTSPPTTAAARTQSRRLGHPRPTGNAIRLRPFSACLLAMIPRTTARARSPSRQSRQSNT